MDVPSKSPASPHGPAAAKLRRAPRRVPFLLGYFFSRSPLRGLGKQRRSNSARGSGAKHSPTGETHMRQHDNRAIQSLDSSLRWNDELKAGSSLRWNGELKADSGLRWNGELKADSSLRWNDELKAGSSLRWNEELKAGSSLCWNDELKAGSSLRWNDEREAARRIGKQVVARPPKNAHHGALRLVSRARCAASGAPCP